MCDDTGADMDVEEDSGPSTDVSAEVEEEVDEGVVGKEDEIDPEMDEGVEGGFDSVDSVAVEDGATSGHSIEVGEEVVAEVDAAEGVATEDDTGDKDEGGRTEAACGCEIGERADVDADADDRTDAGCESFRDGDEREDIEESDADDVRGVEGRAVDEELGCSARSRRSASRVSYGRGGVGATHICPAVASTAS
ncbi:hypothetical protein CF326_g9312 [Tilletia indica]|nr:hypothetical protein CF326_g9312 [Tilletia indica]